VSGFAVETQARIPAPTFLRLLWRVLLGYVGAVVTLILLALPFEALGLVPRPYAGPIGPFEVTGVWSLDADLVVAAVVVLVTALWIRSSVGDVTDEPVSLSIVGLAVAITGFAPYLELRPVALSGVIALPATTWLVRRYAVGRSLPLPRPSWRVWTALAVAGLLVFCSYRVYHPLSSFGGGIGDGSSGHFRVLTLNNPGFADLTVTRVVGGTLSVGLWNRVRLPHTIPARGSTEVFVHGRTCMPRTVTVTFSVLGRTSAQRFSVGPEQPNVRCDSSN
jgi:hypothetical protein